MGHNLSKSHSEASPDTLISTSGYLDMLPIALTNAVLAILTFNVYIFWAKTNVRDYLWRNTILEGRSLVYSGEGTELARGFVVIGILFGLLFGYPGLLVINALNIDPELLTFRDMGLLASVVLAAVVPVLISFATLILAAAPEVETTAASAGVSAGILYLGIVGFSVLSRFLTYRYLFQHTHWEGSAGNTKEHPWRYTMRMLLPELSTWPTLGWSAPWRFMRRFELMLDGATFIGRTISFKGSARSLYPHFAVAWVAVIALITALNVVSSLLDPESTLFVLQIVIIGLLFFFGVVFAMAYYNSKLFAHVADSITLGGIRLTFNTSTTDLVLLYFTNLVMNLLSVGVSYYYSRMRIARFITRHLQIQGDIPAASDRTENPERKALLAEGAEILAAASYF